MTEKEPISLRIVPDSSRVEGLLIYGVAKNPNNIVTVNTSFSNRDYATELDAYRGPLVGATVFDANNSSRGLRTTESIARRRQSEVVVPRQRKSKTKKVR